LVHMAFHFLSTLQSSKLFRDLQEKEVQVAKRCLELKGKTETSEGSLQKEIRRNRATVAVIVFLILFVSVFMVYVSVKIHPIRKAALLYVKELRREQGLSPAV
jgi:hypothetical protein